MIKFVLPEVNEIGQAGMRVMVFSDEDHIKRLLVKMPIENISRLMIFQDYVTCNLMLEELVERNEIMNEIKPCLMIEQKYDESRDKIPVSTWVMGTVIVLVILGAFFLL